MALGRGRIALTVAVAMAIAPVLLGACGESVDSSPGAEGVAGRSLDLGEDAPEPTMAIQPITEAPISPLPAGTYRTTVGPIITFTVDDRWDLEAMSEDGAGLLFGAYSLMEVTAPRAEWIDLDVSGARVVPDRDRRTTGAFPQEYFEKWETIPDDLAGWFATESGLEVGSIDPVVIGGAAGVTFPFTVPSPIQNSEACVVWPCLRLLGGRDWAWVGLQGDVGRIWLMEVDGSTLLIQVRAQPKDAEVVLPAGTALVESMRFEDGPR